ncbi:APC family permease [Pseudarthrobacter sp. J75]|uniref:APC family permease n=1 Tax=unclassified Pseudarthrobacter TaxID=2647000 RepID=UPI002E80A3E3|nr:MULTISPECIES: APC family permease [unclassified Pseudarthrobacter]MEE2524118.1 APC family permease [Pseudarthrobacter sp. J47]MEE2530397.1 APC family permease [Pseudarthrobacter sp. J75]MEE2568831.1 APC family permease [Pseudarthrobacter sp. J64]
MSISNSKSRTTDAPAQEHSTALRAGSIGVLGILFFVLSAQAPLTGIVGATPLAAALGNGAGAPGAYLVVGVVIVIFAVGFVAMSRRIQANGAFYAYVTAAFGRSAGAGAAWLALLAYNTIQAAMYGLYGAAFSGLLASMGLDIPWWLLALATMAGVQVLGSLNIELGARVLALLVGLEVAVLLMFGLTILFRGGGPEGLDLATSFSPGAIASGAPGVAIMFAVASMFGFESTAIYSAEAKDPHRTVARATYLSVGVIAIFFSFISWMLVSYYGPSQVVDAAGAALESGDATTFVLGPMVELFGPWAGVVTGVLLVTSLLAGIIAFHNGINRYLHSLALRGSLPAVVARTNRHRAPAVAAWIQTAAAVVLVVPFAVLALDPVLTLFSWFSGLAVAALLVLYILCSLAVVGFFRREREPGQLWQTLIAPSLAAALLCWILALVVSNFTALIGGSAGTAAALLVTVPVVFVAGALVEKRVVSRSGASRWA